MTTQLADSRAEAMAIFRRYFTYLSGPSAAETLWRRLTPVQRQLLGGSLTEALDRHGHTIKIWTFLQGVPDWCAVVELAVKLLSFPAAEADWLLREMGALPLTAEAAQDAAIAQGHLVLERSTRSVWWRNELIEADWHKHGEAWEFLVLACEHAQRGERIDRMSFGRSADENGVAHKKNRLKNAPGFPRNLIDLFKIAGRGTQLFEIERDHVHIFE